MAAALPFPPSQMRLTYNAPRRNFRSSYVSVAGQLRTQDGYWSGEVMFPPMLDADTHRQWRAFIAELESGGAFHVPLMTPGWTESADDWQPLDRLAQPIDAQVVDGLHFHFHSGEALAAGQVVEIRSADEADLTMTSIVRAPGVLADFNQVLALLPGALEGNFRSPRVRAVATNSDYESLVQQDFIVGQPSAIAWRESKGYVISRLQVLAEAFDPDLSGRTITTEADDPITSEADAPLATE